MKINKLINLGKLYHIKYLARNLNDLNYRTKEMKIMKKIVMIFGLVLALTATMALSAGATMISGSISFSGTTTFDIYNLNRATQFLSFSYAEVSGGDGDYSSVLAGTSVTFNPFGFRAPNVTATPFKLWTFDFGGDTFSLFATSITVSFSNKNNIVVEGSGIAYITGYDPTPGFWSVTGNSAGTTASFSASAEFVPEPATMLLFGGGLVGIGIFARRKFHRT